MERYRLGFKWNASKKELQVGEGPSIHPTMEYAILLARVGREDDAKAIYYFGLRDLNVGDDRLKEPVPFLVVFDPDSEGIAWEYTTERFEAAVLMIQAMHGGTIDFGTRVKTTPQVLTERAHQLAPDWFFPVLYRASRGGWREDPAVLEARALALAKPGLEKDLVERYISERSSLKEHFRQFGELPPMKEGNERRARMQCLKPNESILKRLSVTGPAGQQ